MSVALLQLIETRLEAHSPRRKRLRRFRKRSAVAMILQVRDGELHILMIKRAERAGRMDRTDANGFAVALRETEEEVGLSITEDDRCIGRLSEITASPHRGLGLVVTPFVFRLEREVSFRLNHEVAEVIWVPLEFLMDEDNREQMVWEYRGAKFNMPCYRYQGRRIWGLSLMMLGELMDLIVGARPRRVIWRR